MKLEKRILKELKALDNCRNQIEYHSRYRHIQRLMDRYESNRGHRYNPVIEAYTPLIAYKGGLSD